MPGRRCVVQDCGNVKNDELGISIHNSPDSGSVRLKWKRFVSIHRKDFNPVGKFAVWSEHFTRDCFTLAFPMKDMKRSWRRGRFQPFGKNPLKHYQSGVDDRWVKLQCICAVLITIISFYFPIYLWHDFFLASLFNIRVMNALTIWTSHIVACVFILFCFLLIVIVKRAIALSGLEVNSPIPRPFHSSVKFRKSEAT